MPQFSRREIAVASLAVSFAASSAAAKDRADISRNNAAIHQEIEFQAGADRVYGVLTTTALFDKVVQASAAMNSGMKSQLGTSPTMIDAQPGGAFSLFGGYLTGRTLELVANARIVQAWRAGSWGEGLYSIARFVLEDRGTACRLTFDHTGFPNPEARHLARGWHDNYWTPMAKVLAQG